MVLYAHTQLTKGQPTVLNSTEVLVDLPGYEGVYKVSSLGYITNGRKKLKTYTINSGYLCLKLHDANGVRKSHLLHRLIAQAFIPNPSNFPEVNHIDGIKANCALDNLEWQTPQGNKKHAKDIGLWEYNKPSTGIKLGRTSQYRYLTWDNQRNKWLIAIRVDNKNIGQKRFDDELEAAMYADSLVKSLGLNRPLNFS